MNNNPHNLKEGSFVLLDGKELVKIVSLTSSQLFAKVSDNANGNNAYQVMTLRLTPKNK